MSDPRTDKRSDVLEKTKTEKPKLFKVLIHNDDYTTMEFVQFVLIQIFRHTSVTATRLMLQIHRSGIGVAGVYPREIAETRVEQTVGLARDAGHPLQCTMEPE